MLYECLGLRLMLWSGFCCLSTTRHLAIFHVASATWRLSGRLSSLFRAFCRIFLLALCAPSPGVSRVEMSIPYEKSWEVNDTLRVHVLRALTSFCKGKKALFASFLQLWACSLYICPSYRVYGVHLKCLRRQLLWNAITPWSCMAWHGITLHLSDAACSILVFCMYEIWSP